MLTEADTELEALEACQGSPPERVAKSRAHQSAAAASRCRSLKRRLRPRPAKPAESSSLVTSSKAGAGEGEGDDVTGGEAEGLVDWS